MDTHGVALPDGLDNPFQNNTLEAKPHGVNNFYAGAAAGLLLDSTPSSASDEETPSVTKTVDDPAPQGQPALGLWGRILDRVRSKVNPQSYSTWFEPTRLVEVHDGELVVEGPDQFFVDWLAEHHLEKVEEAALHVLGKRPSVTFRVASGALGVQRLHRAQERAEP